jgi:hypothetical protein
MVMQNRDRTEIGVMTLGIGNNNNNINEPATTALGV